MRNSCSNPLKPYKYGLMKNVCKRNKFTKVNEIKLDLNLQNFG